MEAQTLVDYTKSLDCVHCGLCLSTCPTYVASGLESRSPRGRIHIMRSLAEGSAEVDVSLINELDSCLLCRNCETVCPSGVDYTHLLAHTREQLANDPRRSWLSRTLMRLGLRMVLPNRTVLRIMGVLLRAGEYSGIVPLLARALGPLGATLRNMPPVPPIGDQRLMHSANPAHRPSLGPIAFLEGCVMPVFFGRVNRASAKVLQHCGCDVHVPSGHTCCGALHAHNGDLEGARSLARKTIEAFDVITSPDGSPAPVIVNSAGCSAQMKEYGELLVDDPQFKDRAQAFAARVRDFSEYLADEALDELDGVLDEAAPDVPTPITFDDPCHLCHAQNVRSQPRVLLDRLPLERVNLHQSESCCGSAGLFAILRPAESQEILQPKLEALRASGARTLVTANPGCHLQWQAGVRRSGMDVEVLHIAEVLERSL